MSGPPAPSSTPRKAGSSTARLAGGCRTCTASAGSPALAPGRPAGRPGRLEPGAPERFAFYQLEHCLDVLGWAYQADPAYFAQAQWLIEQVLDGVRLRLA